ncbi:MAG: serine/threonine-protein kinase [Myxococcaceae bacterium]
MTAIESIPEAWPEALSARFAPHRQLGRGSFGTVFEATDRARGAKVAVKVLRADRLHALQSFKREFRALADLAHAHLVPLYELGREGDTWFLVMEPIEGLDLLDALRAKPELVRRVFAQIALGLAFLHSSGRLHRDLKPSNVRVTSHGDAVVLDFGLAVDEAPDESEGMVGAAAWLSPEQAAGAPASTASDLYALGVMLHEALSGRRPFQGSALEVLAAKRAHDVVIDLPGADPSLALLCQRLLARTPAHRPSAAEVVSTLEPTLAPLLEQRPEVTLIGRADVLSRLQQASAPAAVWLHGPPGMGKSSIVRHFLREQRDDGALVLTSRCFEHESTPFKTIDGLVDGLARWLTTAPQQLETQVANLARSFPVLRPLVKVPASDSPPERHRHESAIALRELLHTVAQQRRLVIAIDDLHWADADSIPFLRELLDTPTTAPVLFVLALRDEAHAQLEPLRRMPAPAGCAARVDVALGPLSPDDSLALLQALRPDATRVVAGAQGNPFLLQALAGHDDLDAAVHHRLEHLPEPARHLLETVCLARAPLPRAAWVPAARLVQADALALGHLRAARLARVRADGTLEPYHDTLRRAVVRTITPAVARTRHAALAEALAQLDADPELLAAHLHASDQLPAAAAQALRGAERALSMLAYNHAADLFSKVLAWAPGRADETTLLRQLGTALSNAGRGAEAADAFLRAAASADDALELKTRAGAQLLRAGHVERGLELTREALEARGLSLARSPQGAFASLVWTRARLKLRGYEFVRRPAATVAAAELARIDTLTSTSIGLAAIDSLRASDLMSQALLRALDAGEPTRIAVCLGYETAFSANSGGAGEARTLEVLARCEAVTATIDDAYAHACTFGGGGIASFHLGRLKEAQTRCEQAAARFAKCPGAVKETFTSELFAMVALGQAGELGEVSRRLQSALPAARERGDRYVEATLRTGLPNLSWLALDDEARAREELKAAKPGLNTVSYSVQHFFEFMARLNVELYANGRPLDVIDDSLPALERSLLSRSEWIGIYRPWMVGRALLAAKRSGRAVSAHAKAIEKKQRPWGDALALGLRAGARVVDGDERAAIPLLERASELAERSELVLFATCCEFALGKLRGDEPALERAHERARRLGVKDLEKMRRVYLPGTFP